MTEIERLERDIEASRARLDHTIDQIQDKLSPSGIVVPATSKVAHLRDNMRAGVGALPDERLRERIAAAAR